MMPAAVPIVPPPAQRMTRLFIDRRVGSSVEISGPCRVVIKEINRGKVKVAIEADERVKILRDDAVRTLPRGAYLAPPAPLAVASHAAQAS